MKIVVDHLTKELRGAVVLEDVCAVMESGYIYGLQGVNGSGKTMLLRAICGLIRPSSGGVYIDGQLLGKAMDFPPSVGLLLENPSFLLGYTGRDNLLMLARLRGMGVREVEQALELVGLQPDDKRKFRKYSLGMKQRLGIAGAILGGPELVVLDEPFNALDPQGVQDLHRLILRLKEEKRLVILACHVAGELQTLADTCFTMEKGRLLPNEEKP